MLSSVFDWSSWTESAYQNDPNLPRIVIAEGGINHNGSVDEACRIVEMASRAGAHAVKFQKRNPELCVPHALRDHLRETPWGAMTYFDYKKKTELGITDFQVIDEFARSCSIDWFVSSWDVSSQIEMRQFDNPLNKIASAMLTHTDLLREVASEHKLTFISTGMSSLQDVDAAVEIFDEVGCPFILMHAVSSYPASDHELNLRMIETLRMRYGRPIGYSGHESSVSPSVVAASLGAVAIERHVTLDRTMWGTDQAASLESAGLTSLVDILKRIPTMLGDGVKSVSAREFEVAQKLRYWT